MPPRTPETVRPGRLGGEGTTATPTSQHWKAHGSSPPRRDPPPGPHLREDQVGDARKCPRNIAATPRRDLTYARSRLGTARKGTVIKQAHPTTSTAAERQQEMPQAPRRGARHWGKVDPTPSNGQMQPGCSPTPCAKRRWRTVGCVLAPVPSERARAHSETGSLRCHRANPRPLKARAAWRRRHHRNR